jgi:hypothetical protein
MSKTYNIGEVHEFTVIDLREFNEQKFLILSDGFRDTYRVLPFDFQIEWEPYKFPKTLKCFVKNLDHRGLPFLNQHRKSVLEGLFEKGSEHTFKVSSVNTDEQTGYGFLILLDEYGLKHRYYPNTSLQDFEIGQEVELTVEGVEETDPLSNKSHLCLMDRFIDDSPTLVKNDGLEVIVAPSNEDDAEVSNPADELESLGEENSTCEFKTSIVYVPGTGRTPDIDQQIVFILKTIAGFLNAKGGKLYIGVNDSGNITGIEADLPHLNSSATDLYEYKANPDHFELKIRNNVKYYLGTRANAKLEFHFKSSKQGLLYCLIEISKSEIPVLMGGNKLFQRTGNMTQQLKGDDLRTFIENKFIDRYKENFGGKAIVMEQQQETLDLDDPIESLTDPSELKVNSDIVINPKKTEEKTWYFMTFYTSGKWSVQSKPKTDRSNILHEVKITTALKKGRLLQIYDNGCVNVTTPYDLIMTKGKNGRKLRKLEHQYSNGWNTEANLLKVCLVNEYDLIGVESKINGIEHVKIHNVADISPKDLLHLKGNILLNIPPLSASLEQFKVISNEDRFLISELILKRHHKTTTAGFRKFSTQYQSSVLNYEKLACFCS